MKAKPGYKLVTNFFKKEIEIPDNWDYLKFNQVVKINPLTKIDEDYVPYIPMDAVDTKKPNLKYFEERKLSENSSLSKFQENDVLFARITPSTENGKTCLIKNFKRKGIVSSELTVLRPSDKVLPIYLYYYVKNHRLRQFAISQMMGSTGRQRVPDYVFKRDLDFDLPPLKEQEKIAFILSNIENLIDLYDKEITQTKSLKQSLIQQLLTTGIDHEEFKTIQFLPRHLSVNIPSEWKSDILENTLKRKPQNGITKKLDMYGSGVPIVEIDSLCKSDFFVDDTSLRNIQLNDDEIKNYSLMTDDFLINRVSKVRGGSGLIALIKNPKKFEVFEGNIIRFSLDEKIILPEFFEFFSKTFLYNNYIQSTCKTTTLTSLDQDIIFKIPILIPSLNEQKKIIEILSNITSNIIDLESKKLYLENLKKGLMQNLLTGKMRVKI
ncbi:MAG: restriction endonuclease subunit S [Nitrosopumilus sp.]|nr:restriction endonuclease subunit S [Nitrosopumilus sp.]